MVSLYLNLFFFLRNIQQADLNSFFFEFKLDFVFSCVAEDESEAEEDRSGENSKQPRDSGCFESSENLENGRKEPKTEEDPASDEQANQEEKEEHEQEREQPEENQIQLLDVVQEQLQELTVDEGS